MKKSLSKRKSIIIILLFLLVCNLAACSPIRENALVEVENEEEQYEEIERELRDLKTIKVKCLAPERFEEMQKKIYENYFYHKEDTEHLREEESEDSHALIYEKGDIYQYVDWGDTFVSYQDGFLFADFYETTEERVIKEEIEKLFKILGLGYGNEEDGYMIGRMVVQGNNMVDVYMKKYMDGKELSPSASMTAEASAVEDVWITFGDNRIICIQLFRLSEAVEIENYGEEVLVDDPQKACKLLNNYLSTWGYERKTMDEVRIAYVTSKEENGVYTLRPMVEFYLKPDINAEIGKVFRVDLTTKEVSDTFYGNYWEN